MVNFVSAIKYYKYKEIMLVELLIWMLIIIPRKYMNCNRCFLSKIIYQKNSLANWNLKILIYEGQDISVLIYIQSPVPDSK